MVIRDWFDNDGGDGGDDGDDDNDDDGDDDDVNCWWVTI